MKAKELLTKDVKELRAELAEKRQELATLRFGKTTKPMTNHRVIRELKKDIARLLLSLKASRKQDTQALASLRAEMHSMVYNMFLLARYDKAEQAQGNGASE